MIKLVAIDLDDTLINNRLEIPQENLDAIKRVRAKGIQVVVATGRMHTRAMPYASQLGLPVDEFLISYNGALLQRMNGEFINTIPLEHNIALGIVELCQKRGWTLNVYHDDRLFVEELDENVKFYAEMTGAEAEVVGDLRQFVVAEKIKPTKLLIVGDDDHTDDILEAVETGYGSVTQITRSKLRYIEITHLEATKGQTLARLATDLGIKQSEVMAIGDGGNDIGMIEWAKIGVAMANAPKPVQSVADFVTKSNDEAGVAHALERFLLKEE